METGGTQDIRASPWGRVPEPLFFQLFNEDALELCVIEVIIFFLDSGQSLPTPKRPGCLLKGSLPDSLPCTCTHPVPLSGLQLPDGVIIHLEPDIPDYEVKWALGSITTKKANGSDRIPGSYFKF